MRAELRADGLHISGYVNVPGRTSRPVMTPRGRGLLSRGLLLKRLAGREISGFCWITTSRACWHPRKMAR